MLLLLPIFAVGCIDLAELTDHADAGARDLAATDAHVYEDAGTDAHPNADALPPPPSDAATGPCSVSTAVALFGNNSPASGESVAVASLGGDNFWLAMSDGTPAGLLGVYTIGQSFRLLTATLPGAEVGSGGTLVAPRLSSAVVGDLDALASFGVNAQTRSGLIQMTLTDDTIVQTDAETCDGTNPLEQTDIARLGTDWMIASVCGGAVFVTSGTEPGMKVATANSARIVSAAGSASGNVYLVTSDATQLLRYVDTITSTKPFTGSSPQTLDAKHYDEFAIDVASIAGQEVFVAAGVTGQAEPLRVTLAVSGNAPMPLDVDGAIATLGIDVAIAPSGILVVYDNPGSGGIDGMAYDTTGALRGRFQIAPQGLSPQVAVSATGTFVVTYVLQTTHPTGQLVEVTCP